MNKCHICHKEFSTKFSLTRHMKIHTGEKLFKCDTCEKAFSQEGNLIVHERIHTGEKSYSCDTCEKAFSQKGHLIVHKRIHTEEKPFKCDICDKAFSHKNTLVYHKSIHTGEKPFSCATCDKTFLHQSELTLHSRIHTGIKPFSCELCQKYFIAGSELSQHNVTARHLNKLESTKYTVPHSASTSLVDCGEADVKLEIKEEETLYEDPLSIKMKADTSASVACIEVQNKKSFSCDVCFKIFKSKEVLSIHKYLHPGPKNKLEIKEEGPLDEDPLSVKAKVWAENVEETIKHEIEKKIQDKDSLSSEQNPDENGMNTIDIVEHKIEI